MPFLMAKHSQFQIFLKPVIFQKVIKHNSKNTIKDRIRIGVIGSGNIAGRFISEAAFVPEVQITAIYNPHLESAISLAEEKHIGTATDDWDLFIEGIDAGYIAVPHLMHQFYVKELLKAGKRVLCEKPMSLSVAELQESFELAESKGLLLMEALKTLYSPGFKRLLSDVKKVGQIYEVDAAFTKLMPHQGRVFDKAMAGGSFTELGSYPLIPVMKILGCDYQDIRFFPFIDQETGVDIYTKALIFYRDQIADIRVGVGAKTEGNLVVTGSRGYILAQSPWWLTSRYDICYEDRSQNEHVEVPFEGDGLRYEIRAFAEMVRNGKTASEQMKRESLFLADVMEHFLKREAEID